MKNLKRYILSVVAVLLLSFIALPFEVNAKTDGPSSRVILPKMIVHKLRIQRLHIINLLHSLISEVHQLHQVLLSVKIPFLQINTL